MEQMGFYLGIDGGGTKSRCMLEFDDGRRTAQLGGPLNICSVPRTEVSRTLDSLFGWAETVSGDLSLCRGVGIGAAGFTDPQAEPFFRQKAEQWFPGTPVALDTDAAVALYGAHLGREGIVLVAGTGSVCFGRKDGQACQVGGGGHIIDDGGSGYALGRDILTAVLKAMDGRIPPTVLTEAVRERCGISRRGQLIHFVYGHGTGKEDIAALAPLLFPACRAGDEAALAIADRAAEDLADMVLAAARQLDMPRGPVAFSGSVLTKEPWFLKKICKILDRNDANMVYYVSKADAVAGAVLMARWASEQG